MSWARLCQREPQLRDLAREASDLPWSDVCQRLRRLVDPHDYTEAVERLAQIWAAGPDGPTHRGGRRGRSATVFR